jgi:peroxiredoxin
MRHLILGLLLVMPNIALGKAKLPFSLPQMNGNGGMFNSADHPNSVFVVEAYFEECPYCNENSDNIQRLTTRFVGKDVQILDVGIDRDKSSYEAWIQNHAPNHPVLQDSSRVLLSGDLKTSSFPTTYVVQCDGEVLYKQVGVWNSGSRINVEQAMLKGLNKRCQ